MLGVQPYRISYTVYFCYWFSDDKYISFICCTLYIIYSYIYTYIMGLMEIIICLLNITFSSFRDGVYRLIYVY